MSEFSYPPINLDNRTLGYVAIALMLICAPAGVLLSYTDRYRSTPLLASHYRYLIATFWQGAIILAVGWALSFLLSWFILLVPTAWYVLRCGKSFVLLRQGAYVADRSTWLI